MSNIDSALFWLDQESVDGTEDLYLPADTPIQHLSLKIMNQKNARSQKRANRTSIRVGEFFYCKLKDLRKLAAIELRTNSEPEESLAKYIQLNDNSDFLQDKSEEFSELLSYISKVKSKQITYFSAESGDTKRSKVDNSQSKSSKHKKDIEEFYNSESRKLLQEYTKIDRELSGNRQSSSTPPPSQLTHTTHATNTESLQIIDRNSLPRDPRLR